MPQKRTLREYAEDSRKLIPEVEWVTFDGKTVRLYSDKIKPTYDRKNRFWLGDVLGIIFPKRGTVSITELKVKNFTDYSRCIWGFTEYYRQLEEETKSKAKQTYRKKGVVAFFADGSTVRFDTYEEAKDFFGLKRIDTLRKYIETGNPLPDGKTTLDEAVDDEFIKDIFHN